MTIERDISNPSGETLANNNEMKVLSAADEIMRRKDKKIKMMQILDRGVIGDRLSVDVPKHLYPEWVPNDDGEIFRMQAMGFRFPDSSEYSKRGLHTDGTSKVIVGDVVLMVCDREDKEIIDEIRDERFRKLHGKPGDNSQGEELGYKAQVRKADRDNYIGTLEESSTREARKAEIEAALIQSNSPAASPVIDPSNTIR